jgi:hypothetical protein
VLQCRARRRVHAARRLVEQQHRRAADRDRRDRDALPLTTRQAARVGVGKVGEMEHVQPVVDRRVVVVPEQTLGLDELPPHRRREQHGVRVLRHVGDAILRLDRARPGSDEARERAQQRGLAGAVAAEQCDHITRAQVEVDAAHDVAAAERDAHVVGAQDGISGRRSSGRRSRRIERRWIERGTGTRVAHGEGQRVPPEQTPEARHARRTRIRAEHRADRGGFPHSALVDQHGSVGEGRGALEPVLGQHDGRAEVVVEPHQRREHVVGTLGIELRRRFVEHQRLRSRRQRARDGAALAFAARERRRIAIAQVRDPEGVEHLLHSTAHRLLREPEVLEYEGEVSLDMIDDRL